MTVVINNQSYGSMDLPSDMFSESYVPGTVTAVFAAQLRFGTAEETDSVLRPGDFVEVNDDGDMAYTGLVFAVVRGTDPEARSQVGIRKYQLTTPLHTARDRVAVLPLGPAITGSHAGDMIVESEYRDWNADPEFGRRWAPTMLHLSGATAKRLLRKATQAELARAGRHSLAPLLRQWESIAHHRLFAAYFAFRPETPAQVARRMAARRLRMRFESWADLHPSNTARNASIKDLLSMAIINRAQAAKLWKNGFCPHYLSAQTKIVDSISSLVRHLDLLISSGDVTPQSTDAAVQGFFTTTAIRTKMRELVKEEEKLFGFLRDISTQDQNRIPTLLSELVASGFLTPIQKDAIEQSDGFGMAVASITYTQQLPSGATGSPIIAFSGKHTDYSIQLPPCVADRRTGLVYALFLRSQPMLQGLNPLATDPVLWFSSTVGSALSLARQAAALPREVREANIIFVRGVSPSLVSYFRSVTRISPVPDELAVLIGVVLPKSAIRSFRDARYEPLSYTVSLEGGTAVVSFMVGITETIGAAINGYHHSKSNGLQRRLKGPPEVERAIKLGEDTAVGVELEIELHPDNRDAPREHYTELLGESWAKAYSERFKDAKDNSVFFERDGSLSNGFELVSSFGPLETIRHCLIETFKAGPNGKLPFRKKLSSHDTTTCGLHVHLDAPKSPLHAARMLEFWRGSEIRPLIKAVARRDYSNYNTALKDAPIDRVKLSMSRSFAIESERIYAARNEPNTSLRAGPIEKYRRRVMAAGGTKKDVLAMISRAMNNAKIAAVKGMSDSRYNIVNTTSGKTFEIRAFRGTLNPVTMVACIEFAWVSWHYTKFSSGRPTIKDFVEFINLPQWRADTRHLRAYLATRGKAILQKANQSVVAPKRLETVDDTTAGES